MITLWQRMGELYGHRWISAYGDPTETHRDRTGDEVERMSPTVQTWRRALSDITREELGRGIRECLRRGEEWPPSAPQFRERCRPARQPYEREEFQQHALPKPRNPEVGREALREIYAKLGTTPHGEA